MHTWASVGIFNGHRRKIDFSSKKQPKDIMDRKENECFSEGSTTAISYLWFFKKTSKKRKRMRWKRSNVITGEEARSLARLTWCVLSSFSQEKRSTLKNSSFFISSCSRDYDGLTESWEWEIHDFLWNHRQMKTRILCEATDTFIMYTFYRIPIFFEL